TFSRPGALKKDRRESRIPLLGKGGWLRPLKKCGEASLAGADGVVGSNHRLSEVERTILPCFALSGSHSLRSCPAAPRKERNHLLDGAATPPLPRRGVRLTAGCSRLPSPAGDLWVMISPVREGAAKRRGRVTKTS